MTRDLLRDLMELALVTEFAYSRDKSHVSFQGHGRCPYTPGIERSDCMQCIAFGVYPIGSIIHAGDGDDRELSEFGFCKRWYKELLEIMELERKSRT